MTRQSLLNAILDKPGDDLARLVYADWLEEHGVDVDAKRAKVIREAISDPRYEVRHTIDFPDCLSKIVDPRASRSTYTYMQHGFSVCQWSRGFIATIDCTLDEWLKWGPKIVRLHPVEELRITDKQPSSEMLARGFCGFFHGGNKMELPREVLPWVIWTKVNSLPRNGPLTPEQAKDALNYIVLTIFEKRLDYNL